jgi:hypothetical protein
MNSAEGPAERGWPSIWGFFRIDQTCLGRSGGFVVGVAWSEKFAAGSNAASIVDWRNGRRTTKKSRAR